MLADAVSSLPLVDHSKVILRCLQGSTMSKENYRDAAVTPFLGVTGLREGAVAENKEGKRERQRERDRKRERERRNATLSAVLHSVP